MNITVKKRGIVGKMVVFLALPFLLYAVPSYTSAQGCPNPGEVPITAGTRPLATQAGIPPTSNCWKPTDTNIGMDAAQAKQYLNSIWCRNTRLQCGGHVSNVEQLNPQFAVCVATFLKKMRQVDSSLCLNNAFRSTALQRCMCGRGKIGCLPAGQSNHQKGIAVDVNFPGHHWTSPKYQWLKSEVRKFGGLRNITIAWDPYHIEAAAGNCATAGYQPGDPSGFGSAPSSGLTNQLRNLFNPPQQPQVQNPQQRPPQQQQPQPTSPLPTSQTLSNAFSPTTPDVVTPQATTPAPITSSANAKKEKEKLTAVEQISEWVLGTIATEPMATGTGAFFELVSSDGSVTTLEDGSQSTTGTTSTNQVGGSVYAEQTFTSPDLSGYALEQETKRSYYQELLESMKETLVRILAYLQPFGRPAPEDGNLHYE